MYEPNKPGGMFSYLRIRYHNTAGGVQFGLKQLNSLGQEGSGFYSPEMADIAVMAMSQVAHYHRPTRFTNLVREQRKENLFWFAIAEPKKHYSTDAALAIAEDLLNPKIDTIILTPGANNEQQTNYQRC